MTGHVHTKATRDYGNAFKLGITINLAFIATEVYFGFRSGSMALVADAGHNFGDVLASCMGLDLPAGTIAIPVEVITLVRVNIWTMNEMREAHKRPVVVSFQSIRDTHEYYNRISNLTSIRLD